MEPGYNGRDKFFIQRRPGKNGAWIDSLKGINSKPLYRLPDWINAPKDERLFIVEGEKDADNLFKLGMKATTNAGGGRAWNLENYNELVRGRPIVIIPDNDKVGKEFMEKVASEIWDKVPSVRVLKLPGMKIKGDVSDWIEVQKKNGLSDEKIRAELLRMVSATASLTEADIEAVRKEIEERNKEVNRENARAKKMNKKKERQTPKEIADAFLAEHNISGRSVYRSFRGMWHLYRDNAHMQIMHDDIKAAVMAFLRERFPHEAISSVRNNVIANLESKGIATIPSYYPYPCWLPGGESAAGWTFMRNCILNVEMAAKKIAGINVSRNDVIRDHTPDLFSTFHVNFDYDPDAGCPKFKNFIADVQPDPQGRDILQLLCGLSLVPDTRYEVIFLLFGEAGTGKSTFNDLLRGVVGPANVCCLPLSKFSEKHSLHLLTENLLNIVGDLPTSDGLGNLHMNEGMLKDVSSGGDIPVERKGKDPLTAPAIARCIFASNSLPAFADRSNGIWDRLRIIPFNERFRGTPRHNPNLKKEIMATELSGIFNWALEGLAKLRSMRRFPEHPQGKDIASEHRFACDHERQFLSEDYEEKETAFIPKVELYNAYHEFCRANGYRPKNAANFGRELKRIFPSVYESREFLASGRQRVWMNIKKQF
jgi:P4 family phage/plasmid primase-like protien